MKRKRSTGKRARRKVVYKPSKNSSVEYNDYKQCGELGLYVDKSLSKLLIPPDKIGAGLRVAFTRINNILGELPSSSHSKYNIDEIQFILSLNASGKFLGFGVGGDASVSIKVKPKI